MFKDWQGEGWCAPRVSGDDPTNEGFRDTVTACSPRKRG